MFKKCIHVQLLFLLKNLTASMTKYFMRSVLFLYLSSYHLIGIKLTFKMIKYLALWCKTSKARHQSTVLPPDGSFSSDKKTWTTFSHEITSVNLYRAAIFMSFISNVSAAEIIKKEVNFIPN